MISTISLIVSAVGLSLIGSLLMLMLVERRIIKYTKEYIATLTTPASKERKAGRPFGSFKHGIGIEEYRRLVRKIRHDTELKQSLQRIKDSQKSLMSNIDLRR